MADNGMTRRAGSLETGLDVLETLAVGRSLGVTEISRRVGADKANVHRLLKVLRARGYVRQDEASKEYQPTAQLVAVAGAIIREMNVLSIVQPFMIRLRRETGESTHLAVPTSFGAVYVAQERSKGVVSVETEIGSAAPLHCTATGKALYAFLPLELLHTLVHDPLESYTMRTITSLAELESDLVRVRERGYAVDDEEYVAGVRCVAAPLFDLHGGVVASLGLSSPATRLALEDVEAAGAVVKAIADQATAQLGGQGVQPRRTNLSTVRTDVSTPPAGD